MPYERRAAATRRRHWTIAALLTAMDDGRGTASALGDDVCRVPTADGSIWIPTGLSAGLRLVLERLVHRGADRRVGVTRRPRLVPLSRSTLLATWHRDAVRVVVASRRPVDLRVPAAHRFHKRDGGRRV